MGFEPTDRCKVMVSAGACRSVSTPRGPEALKTEPR